MDADGSVLVDQGAYTKRNNSPVPVFSSMICNSNRNNTHGFLHRSATQQLLGCHGSGAGTVFRGTRPPLYAASITPLPAPTYWSLPPPHLLQQPSPPLLPLPLSRSISLPSPTPPVITRRVTGTATVRSANSKDHKKPRASPAGTMKGPQPGGARLHKGPAGAAPPPGRESKSAAATAISFNFKEAAAKEGGDFTGDVYALSPPPSSLPMPKFSLRTKTPSSSSSSSSCDAEALGALASATGGVDAGAGDDLRQLLRLQ